MKDDIEWFGRNNLFQDVRFMKNMVEIAMEVLWNNKRRESVYKKKDS